MNKHIHVTCAIIERDGLVLAAKRGAAMKMPHKWEFPGVRFVPEKSLKPVIHEGHDKIPLA